MERQQLIELTADIVRSHITNNHVSVGDLPNLIQSVHMALAGLAAPRVEEAAQKIPVVSARASIKPDYLVCMECGSKQKMLKRHLATSHSMTPEQYRSDYSLARDYPMSAPNYSEQRRSLAKAIGLGRKPGQRRGKAPTDTAQPPAASGEATATRVGPSKAPARRGRRKMAQPSAEASVAPREAPATPPTAPKGPARRARRKRTAE